VANTVTDSAFTKLRGLGYTGTLADMERQYLVVTAATSTGSRADLAKLIGMNPKVPLPVP
jgi:hypothetical protein